MKDVNKVAIFGAQDEKVFVEIAQRRLAPLGLDFNQVLAQLGQQNAIESAGTITAPTDSIQVRVAGQFTSLDDLRRFPIRAGGSAFKLGDIAEIRRATIDPPQVKVRDQGREVIALGISMARGGDIIELGKALEKTSAAIRADLPVGLELRQFQNQAKVVSGSVNEFVGVLIEAILIVLAELRRPRPALQAAASRWRPGLVVGSRSRWCWRYLRRHVITPAVGLHKISLGSLIIALGCWSTTRSSPSR